MAGLAASAASVLRHGEADPDLDVSGVVRRSIATRVRWLCVFTLTACLPAPASRSATPDPLVQITSFEYHTCALTRGGNVVCWGENANGQCDAPTDRFSNISAGAYHTCGIALNGRS